MRKILIVLLILMVALSACANMGQTRKSVVAADEAMAITLESLHKTAEGLCDANKISGKDCNDMVSLYSKARDSFRLAQDTLILTGKATDSVMQKKYSDLYTMQLNDALALLDQIRTLVEKYKK